MTKLISSILIGGCLCALHTMAATEGPRPGKLFATLPNYCPTPDAFDIAPDGSLTLACPNYADRTKPGVLMRITAEGEVTKLAQVPGLTENGKASPMGIAYAPNGSLFVCAPQGGNKGRVLRMTFKDGNLEKTETVAQGMRCPNGIRYHKGALYVTQPQLPKFETGKNTGAVYRFLETDRDITVNNDATDPNLIFKYDTQNPKKQFGLDGLVFDKKGHLLVGDFGDGVIFKLTLDADGTVLKDEVYARVPDTAGADGINIDDKGNLYVAGFRLNQIFKVDTDQKVTLIAQYPDNDGSDGQIDQPADLIVYGNKLVISNFDLMKEPGMVNSGHSAPFTLSYIDLNEIE